MRPATFNSILQCAVVNAGAFRPFGECCRYSIQRKQVVTPLVAALGNINCPPHITRFIVAVVVWVAVNGMLGAGTVADVSQESREIVSPLMADCYSATAVVSPMLNVGILTPLDNANPDFVFGQLRQAVSCVIDSARIAPLTSAALRVGVPQLPPLDDGYLPARADAFPIWAAGSLVGKANNLQSAEYTPGQVYEIVRYSLTLCISHCSYLNYDLWLEPHGVESAVAARFILADSSAKFHSLLELLA